MLAVPATVKFTPRTLKLNSEGSWVSVDITLPEGYSISQVDLNTISIANGGSPLAYALNNTKYGFVANVLQGTEGNDVLRVKFDRQAIVDVILVPSDETVLRIQGKVYHEGGWADFSGTDTIKTTTNGNAK
ncbi:MAG: hypothetical protein QXJ75_03830 [Candidatus Bathyarchaeia archaeon]